MRARERQRVSRGGAERRGDSESEAGSRLWTVSTEPDTGLKLTSHEIMTWAEVSAYPTEPPSRPRLCFPLKEKLLGAWVAQSVKRPTSAQVTISRFMSSSPVSGSVLTAQSLEPASDSVSPSVSAPPLLMLCLSLSKINKCQKNFFKKFGSEKRWHREFVKSSSDITMQTSSTRPYSL